MPTIKKLPKKTKPLNEDIKRKERMKIYNKQLWKDLRILKLQQQPLCQICLMFGKIEPAIDIHHLISWTSGKTEAEQHNLAFDFNNLASLCKEHHNNCHHGKLRGLTSLEAIKRYIEEEEKNNPKK